MCPWWLVADNRETVPPGAAVASTGGVFWVLSVCSAAVPSFNGKVEDNLNCSYLARGATRRTDVGRGYDFRGEIDHCAH